MSDNSDIARTLEILGDVMEGKFSVSECGIDLSGTGIIPSDHWSSMTDSERLVFAYLLVDHCGLLNGLNADSSAGLAKCDLVSLCLNPLLDFYGLMSRAGVFALLYGLSPLLARHMPWQIELGKKAVINYIREGEKRFGPYNPSRQHQVYGIFKLRGYVLRWFIGKNKFIHSFSRKLTDNASLQRAMVVIIRQWC
jgi:hypothetical protein